MDRIFKLPVGVALFAVLALAGLMGVFAFNAAPAVVAQTQGCHTVGTTADEKKAVCYYEFVEHGTGQVARLSALERDITQVVKVWELVTDENDPAGNAADLTAFPDYGHFRIDRDSAVLTFKSSPDYEDPMSMAAAATTTMTLEDENVYKVKAKVGDGEKFLPVEITVQVRGKEELGTVTFSNRQPEVGVKLTAMLADGDIRGLRTPDWQWQVENDRGGFVDIDEAVNAAYTPGAGDAGKKLKVIAQYDDSHGIDYAEVSLESEFAVRAAPASNVAPMFRETDEATTENGVQSSRRIEENTTPGMRVGPPVFATDNNHLAWNHADDPGGPRDVLTYSLGDGVAATTGDGTTLEDGLFSIDQITGQIMTKSPLNYEDLTDRDNVTEGIQLEVTANATDPSGAIGRAVVTIHVLDEVEAPAVTGPAALTYFENQPADGTSDLLLFRDPAQSDADPPDPAHPSPADVTPDNQVTYMATDNDLALTGLTLAGSDIQWQITGDDADEFQFGTGTPVTYTDSPGTPTGTPPVAASPVLQFRSAPDLEDAADEGGTPGDNVYEITVVAWDEDWEIGRRDVTIRVADSNDAGTITLSHVQPQAGTPITATLKDPDDVSTKITWTWSGSGKDKSSGLTSTYTPVADETDTLTVTAMYTDGGGRSETATITSGAARNNPVAADDGETPLVDESGQNTPPKFYEDGVDASDIANRVAEDETETYTRYVLENQTRNVRTSEADARDYDTDVANDVAATVNVFDGYFADRSARETDPPTNSSVMTDTVKLQFDLSGADAKYFSIQNAATPEDQRGLISTKRALDFETKSTYTVTVTATDPAGLTDTVTVTIHVLDVPEIDGLESRIRIDENTKEIADLYNSYPPDNNLGGLKWSLLTTTADPGLETQTSPEHNRNDARSIDCHVDPDNQGLCDDFRFSRFNTANTTLLFAIGTGEDHKAPNYEKPSDRDTGDEATDNVYKIVVRVAFANLRSHGEVNHPNPEDDERHDRVVWIRVDDVDEAPEFDDDASTRLIAENTDDLLPAIAINRYVVGTVTASDPEDTGGATGKKLTYTLDAKPYDNLFQIVPSNGEILTRSRLNYEALTELTEMGPDGGQHRIITVPVVTATDSAMPMGNWDDIGAHIRVNDVNETPTPEQPLAIAGDASVPDYAEDQADTTVGTYMVSGDNANTATWSKEGADADFFMLEGTGMTRMLKFKSVPDYENPMDADTDNEYMVTVKAEAGGEMHELVVTVMVTNVEETGTLKLSSMGGKVGVLLTATLSDGDGPVGATEWLWYRIDSATSSSTAITGARTSSYTPVAADVGNLLKVTATYTDGYDSGNMVSASLTTAVADANRPPEFASATATRSVAENMSAGTLVGSPITATDPNGNDLRYSDSGTDAASFTVDDQGQLRTSASFNYEAKNSYSVTIVATDPELATGSIVVTVNVTNVDEDGMVSLSPTQPSIGTPITATVMDPDGTPAGVTWQWSYSATMGGTVTPYPGETTATITPEAADLNRYLSVTATYTDVYDRSRKSKTATTDGPVTTTPDQPGTVTLSPMTPVVGTAVTATLTDPDGSVTGAMWQWEKSRDMSSWMDITGATTMSYTPMTADVGYYLRATAMYTDGHGPNKMMMATTTSMVTEVPVVISRDDVLAAIASYFSNDGSITRDEVLALIARYFAGN